MFICSVGRLPTAYVGCIFVYWEQVAVFHCADGEWACLLVLLAGCPQHMLAVYQCIGSRSLCFIVLMESGCVYLFCWQVVHSTCWLYICVLGAGRCVSLC